MGVKIIKALKNAETNLPVILAGEGAAPPLKTSVPRGATTNSYDYLDQHLI